MSRFSISVSRISGTPCASARGLAASSEARAIVAASVASRWTDDEIVRHFRKAFVEANPLSDYTLPLISLFGGRRVSNLLRMSLGEREIQDLVLPFFCVTANLTTSRIVSSVS